MLLFLTMETKTLRKLYKDYLENKQINLEVILKELGIHRLFEKIVPSEIENGYRNRTKFQVYKIDEKMLVFGTDPLLGMVNWEQAAGMLPEWGRKVLHDLVDMIENRPYFSPVDGFELQFAHGREEAHVVLSIKRKQKGAFIQIAQDLLKNIPAVKGAAIPSQKISIGREELRHLIFEQDFYSHYQAFFQSNFQLTPLLLLELKQGLGPQTFGRIIDLFCGSGLFSLYLREAADKIIGVDIERSAIDSARNNVERLSVKNMKYFCNPVQKWVENNKIDSSDLVIIDPPRSGCPEPVIQAIGKQRPRLICLISCYLETHSRDLKIWRSLGWEPVLFKAFDMFPFTKFLETITFLERKGDLKIL